MRTLLDACHVLTLRNELLNFWPRGDSTDSMHQKGIEMDAAVFERTAADTHPLEIDLSTDLRLVASAPDPLIPITVTKRDGSALAVAPAIQIPTPSVGGTGNMILQFIPTQGVNGTSYPVRFLVTNLDGYVCEIDAVIRVRQGEPDS